jgi:hypothetical protein
MKHKQLQLAGIEAITYFSTRKSEGQTTIWPPDCFEWWEQWPLAPLCDAPLAVEIT